jgi:hypothetical protein
VKLRRAALTAAAAASLVGSVMLGTGPASAITAGNCLEGSGGSGYMCYYYHSSYNGAEEGVAGKDNDFTSPGVYFRFANDVTGSTSGEGQGVWNDAGSGANFRTDCKAHIYSAVNETGSELTLSAYPNSGFDNSSLGALNNNNRSQQYC